MKRIIIILLYWVTNLNLQAQTSDKMSFAQIDSLTELFFLQGKYEEAIDLVQKAKKQTKQMGMDSSYAQATINLATIYQTVGRYDEAEPLFFEAIAIQAKTIGKKNLKYSQSLCNLATLYQVTGQFEKSEPLFLEALGIQAEVLGKEHAAYAQTLNNIAYLYTMMGRFEQSETFFLEALRIREKILGKENPAYAVSLNNLAQLYYTTNRFELAEPLFVEALGIRTKVLGKEHPLYAQSIGNLATLYTSIGNYKQAESWHLQALDIRAKTLGVAHPEYAINLQSLASLYENMEQYEKAESLFLKSIKIYEQAFGKEHPLYARSLSKLATLYVAIGRYADAEPLLWEVARIRTNILGKEHSDYFSSFINLADFYIEVHKLDTALACITTSITANSTQIDSTLGDYSALGELDYIGNEFAIRALKTLSTIVKTQYEESGDKKKLQLYYNAIKSSMRLSERTKDDFSSDKSKLRILKENYKFVKKGIEAALELNEPNYLQEAFSFAELNKSILLADALKGNRARTLGDLPDSLALQEISLQEKMDGLKKQQVEAKDSTAKAAANKKLNEMNVKIEAFKKSLQDKYPAYHKVKYANITAKVEDIQQLLDDKTLFVEYFLTDSLLYLFAITKTEMRLEVLDVYKKELSLQTQKLRQALTNYEAISKNSEESYKNYTESAFWFYEHIILPALAPKQSARKPTGIKNIIVVADGELGHIPFETFLVEKAPQSGSYANLHYLLRDYNISYNYSATLWKENLSSAKKENNGQILALAADYNSTNLTKIGASNTSNYTRAPHLLSLRSALNPLPAAKAEVMALSELLSGSFLQDTAANERYFKQNANKYGIIHLAMHGILNKQNPILSSLAFTEDGDSLQDNFLEAWEIGHLKLNADLVVLSACETGYGKFEQGEGVLSLARSFMFAGAPALVVSMWEVNDVSTSDIMQLFYKNLAEGMDKAEALKQAKLTYLSKAKGLAAHPAYWSPFIQLGDSRAIKIETKGGLSVVWWLAGGGVLVLGALVVIMRGRKK